MSSKPNARTQLLTGSEAKGYLLQSLSSILGFEDGIEDTFRYLEQIAEVGSDDLAEYLSSLLGSRALQTTKVQEFVQNMIRINNGAAVIGTVPSRSECEISQKMLAVEDNMEVKTERISLNETAPIVQKESTLVVIDEKGKVPLKGNDDKSENLSDRGEEIYSAMKSNMEQTNKEQLSSVQDGTSCSTLYSPLPSNLASGTRTTEVAKENIVKKWPEKKASKKKRRGKAKIVCGCWGNFHKCLTNCLYCGRIACEKEGYGFCPFCGYLIEQRLKGVDCKGNEGTEVQLYSSM